MSKAITEKLDHQTANTSPPGGIGPSVQVEDEPTFARIMALVGAFCTVVGGVALYMGLFTSRTMPWPFTPGYASLILHFGVLCLLFHAAYDKNVEFRRVYQFLGLAAILVGAVFCFLPYAGGKDQAHVGGLLGPGFSFLAVGLLLLLFALRHETDAVVRTWLELSLVGIGVVLAAVGLIYGEISTDFLTPTGLVLALIGLVFAVAFVSLRGLIDPIAYWAGVGIGLVGVIVFAVALGRSSPPLWFVLGPLLLIAGGLLVLRLGVSHAFVNPNARLLGMSLDVVRLVLWAALLVVFVIGLWLVYGTGWFVKQGAGEGKGYFIPYGVLLAGVGLLYLVVSYLTCSERSWTVMMRRELASFFYSPIAYIAIFGAAVFAAISFWLYTIILLSSADALTEPIVKYLIVYNVPVYLYTICVVPALTMRLVSEEKRSGTLEVLLTSPVEDVSVVLSKFFAGLFVFLLVWAPFAVYLLALHVATGKDFDYRPLLSFLVALIVTGSAFVSMGLFFSTVTRNQIISFMLTLGGMMFLSAFVFFEMVASRYDKSGVWKALVTHMNYYDVWNSSMEGKLQPQFLLFPASLTVLWLFLTVKVLEARKWS